MIHIPRSAVVQAVVLSIPWQHRAGSSPTRGTKSLHKVMPLATAAAALIVALAAFAADADKRTRGFIESDGDVRVDAQACLVTRGPTEGAGFFPRRSSLPIFGV